MRSYRAVISARFRMLLQYRAAAAAGFGTQLFWGLIKTMVFEAFYRSTTAHQPMTYREVVDYVWLGQATFVLTLPWVLDLEVLTMMRSGTVVYELLRPLDLYSLWYCRSVAARTAPTLLRAAPLLVVAGLLFGLRPPPTLAAAGAWALALLGALMLSCAMSTLITTSMLWTIAGEGVLQLLGAAGTLLSGMVIPLPLFPEWAQSTLSFLPFRGLMDTPARLYSGNLPAHQVWPLLGQELVWTAAFVLAGRLVLAHGTRRLVVQGG